MNHVKQIEPNGCGIACAAMLAGVTYEQAKAKLIESPSEIGRGRFDQAGSNYGLLPSEVHRLATALGAIVCPFIAPCVVQVRRGDRNHFVVITQDGNVLDPAA